MSGGFAPGRPNRPSDRTQVDPVMFAQDFLELTEVPDGVIGRRNPLHRGVFAAFTTQQHRRHAQLIRRVHVVGGVVLLPHLVRHNSPSSCLAVLGRNEGLRRLIGIESEGKVPKKWNVSRFLDTLGTEPHSTRVREIFDRIVQKLGQTVPDLGRDTAGDSTWLHGRRKSSG